MKTVLIAMGFCLLLGGAQGQNPRKNIYSQEAWEDRDRWQRPGALIRFLKIGKGDRVADVGSHEGYMTFKLAKVVGKEGAVYAVDLLPTRLATLRRQAEAEGLTQVKTIRGEADDPDLPRDTLDAVLMLDTYHEIDDHDKILQHIKASLKPGGRLLICDPIADERRDLPRSAQVRKHELSMNYALEDLKKAGFEIALQMDNYIDRREEKGDRMWVIVALKR